MEQFVTISLIGIAFLIGVGVGWILRPTSRTGIIFDSYDCATKALTITLTSTMQLYVDALDDTNGLAQQPPYPTPTAIQVPNAMGHITIGPLTHENGADKVLICVWAVDKIDTWARDCGGSGSGSGSGVAVRKACAKRSVLP
jgi:hypothetical protein